VQDASRGDGAAFFRFWRWSFDWKIYGKFPLSKSRKSTFCLNSSNSQQTSLFSALPRLPLYNTAPLRPHGSRRACSSPAGPVPGVVGRRGRARELISRWHVIAPEPRLTPDMCLVHTERPAPDTPLGPFEAVWTRQFARAGAYAIFCVAPRGARGTGTDSGANARRT